MRAIQVKVLESFRLNLILERKFVTFAVENGVTSALFDLKGELYNKTNIFGFVLVIFLSPVLYLCLSISISLQDSLPSWV